MNNSINYSGYVDMLLATTDDFEPYGFSMPPAHVAETDGFKANLYLHRETLLDEPWGE